jgi:alcohol dehydrogenase (cytochrome c)
MQLNRNGFLYVIDRVNGKLIAANPFEQVNWATHIDNETGRPVETDVGKKLRAGETIEMWPSTRGGKNWPHAAFNPETGLVYAPTMHRGGIYKHLPVKEHVVGQRYQFIENRPAPVAPGTAIAPCRGDRSLNRAEEVARAPHRSSGLVRHTDHGRPATVHW